jgi:glutamine kinase
MHLTRVIYLGAGAPQNIEKPSSLIRTNGAKRVLDWLIHAYNNIAVDEFHFVGGFQIDSIIKLYPNLHFSINKDWKITGTAHTLFSANLIENAIHFVSYTDVIYRKQLVDKIFHSNADITIAVDHHWKKRYAERPREDINLAEKVYLDENKNYTISNKKDSDQAIGEFIGLIKFSAKATNALIKLAKNYLHKNYDKNITDVVYELQKEGLKCEVIEQEYGWTELNEKNDLGQFILGTKAETLERLKPIVRQSDITSILKLTVADWKSNPEKILKHISATYSPSKVIIRSSALSEDNWNTSSAGKFESVLNVSSDVTEELKQGIEKVAGSYIDSDDRNQIFIQEMLSNISMSGVVTTRILGTNAPYYNINYDDTSCKTDSVTGGVSSDLKTVIISRFSKWKNLNLPESLQSILKAVKEIEELLELDNLDIEFAVTVNKKVFVLQVRPLVADFKESNIGDDEIELALNRAVTFFNSKQLAYPKLHGSFSIFGLMPDWNPAEIIGIRPGRLAASLYRKLVTDDTWAVQRAEYGYKDIRPCNLMVEFIGHPYIDVRASFNSFIPELLPNDLSAKLVEHYLNKLRKNPVFHDKIEFEIAYTCFDFDLRERMEADLLKHGFDSDELDCLEENLIQITKSGIRNINQHYEKLGQLNDHYEQIVASKYRHIDKVYQLLEHVRTYGVLPFAHLARDGFVAVSLLKSLIRKGVIDQSFYDRLFSCIKSVTKDFEKDGELVASNSGKMTWKKFVSKYGHLRPGTYDIMSKAYHEDPDMFLRRMVKLPQESCKNFDLLKIKQSFVKHLEKLGGNNIFDISSEEIFEYITKAIYGREYAKFLFTKNVSESLNQIVFIGEEFGLSRHELSEISIEKFLSLKFQSGINKEYLQRLSKQGMEDNQVARHIELPDIILDKSDLWYFERSSRKGNYVTNKKVIGNIVTVTNSIDQNLNIAGKIVVIPQADPGFDWMFGYEIKGLITKYGGANSHMTIRAAELGLPSVIGVGDQKFEELKDASSVELDCAKENLVIIK